MSMSDDNIQNRPNPLNINSLNNYGFLFFKKTKGLPARQWGGWFSIGGSDPVKFENINNLTSDILWWTNLSKNEYWSLGKFKNIKSGDFFGVDFQSLMKEYKISDESPEVLCKAWSEIFSMVIDQISFSLSKRNIVLNFGDGNCYDFFRKISNNNNENIDVTFEKIIESSYDEKIKIQIPPNIVSNKKIIKLSKSRSVYFKKIINNGVYPDGNWIPIGKDKLPENEDKKRNFIEKNKKFPMLINIEKIKSRIDPKNNWSLKNNTALFFGDRIDHIMPSSIWIIREEYETIKDDCDFEIKNILINDNYTKIKNEILSAVINDKVIFDHSIVKQIITSAYFYSLSSQTRDNNKTRRKFKITPKELWMKKIDNIFCFKMAKNLQEKGFIVVNYGNGEVSIACDNSLNLNLLIETCEKNGLVIPTELLSFGNLISDINLKNENIDNEYKNIIFNQWLQVQWFKYKAIRDVPISLILDRVSYFFNGDEDLSNRTKRIKDNLTTLTVFLKSLKDSDFKDELKRMYSWQITENINTLKKMN